MNCPRYYNCNFIVVLCTNTEEFNIQTFYQESDGGFFCSNITNYLLFPPNVTVNKYSQSNLFKIFSTWRKKSLEITFFLQPCSGRLPVNKLCINKINKIDNFNRCPIEKANLDFFSFLTESMMWPKVRGLASTATATSNDGIHSEDDCLHTQYHGLTTQHGGRCIIYHRLVTALLSHSHTSQCAINMANIGFVSEELI